MSTIIQVVMWVVRFIMLILSFPVTLAKMEKKIDDMKATQDRQIGLCGATREHLDERLDKLEP